MKKKNKNLLVIILIIVGTLAIITSTLLLLQNQEGDIKCFPDKAYSLCNNSQYDNGQFYCYAEDWITCIKGCKINLFGDDYCIK